ncbi:type II secretion system F family protein [Microbacterium sp. NPDC058389]|uniref:type II secretion system F family protein n=1 Tax=Microbacterium sp. NPDC058389 TaxID=3346475 RepID=UPI00365B5B37
MTALRRRGARGGGTSRERGAEAAAETVLRLAVLLQAGVAPARAWTHLAHAGDDAAARVVAALAHETPLATAIAGVGGGSWREVAVAYQVATTVGAPLAACLRSLAAALSDAQEAADDVRVALAEPAGTARLMGWLPLLAVALGAALGFDTLGTLVATPLGIACLAAGVALIIVAQRWTARLVRAARDAGGIPGLDAELVAIALSGGVSIERARAVVADAGVLRCPDGAAGAATSAAPAAAATDDGVEAVLALSRSAGVPAVELLRASAAHARHRARVDGRLRAARLSSRLLVPLGVCTLPAFLLLGVAPMLLSVMSTMSLSL